MLCVFSTISLFQMSKLAKFSGSTVDELRAELLAAKHRMTQVLTQVDTAR